MKDLVVLRIQEFSQLENKAELCAFHIAKEKKVTDILVNPEGEIFISMKNNSTLTYNVEQVSLENAQWNDIDWSETNNVKVGDFLDCKKFAFSEYKIEKILVTSITDADEIKTYRFLRANSRRFKSIIDGSKFIVFE